MDALTSTSMNTGKIVYSSSAEFMVSSFGEFAMVTMRRMRAIAA